MLWIGMTNPPFILKHLKDRAEVLRHPCVYSFLHAPVQSGCNPLLTTMNREDTVREFRIVVDTLAELAPGMRIVTDTIHVKQMKILFSPIEEYKFLQGHHLQGWKRCQVPFMPYHGMEGRVKRIWITEIATDRVHLER